MTDDLTRSQEEAVRRLLAEARETGPMPADVAARLDAVVAGLTRTPSAADAPTDEPTDEPATVVPLHRRLLPRLVLAAAAVTAIGLGGVQVLDRGGEDGAPSDAGGAAESRDSDTSALEDNQRDGVSPPAAADEGRAMAEEGAGGAAPVTFAGLDVALRARGLGPLGRLHPVEQSGRTAARQRGQTADTFSATGGFRAGSRCGPLYAVVDGSAYTSTKRPDTLVVAHPPANGIRLVEVYECAGDDPRHSAAVVTLASEE